VTRQLAISGHLEQPTISLSTCRNCIVHCPREAQPLANLTGVNYRQTQPQFLHSSSRQMEAPSLRFSALAPAINQSGSHNYRKASNSQPAAIPARIYALLPTLDAWCHLAYLSVKPEKISKAVQWAATDCMR
jgi:hypothetical protein